MNINPAITRTLHRSLLHVQKHSPLVLTAAGVVGVVVSGVMAARATLKLEATTSVAEMRLRQAEEEDGHSKRGAVVRNSLDLVKLYAPSITLGAASLVCIISAQGIMHRRNAALVVAYKGLESAFAKYRERVVEEYGPEVEKDIYLGLRDSEITDENGKKVKVKVPVDENAQYGDYTAIFGTNNPNWTGVPEANRAFLEGMQNYLNDLLRLEGHVFLNDVWKRLGLPQTKTGQIVGWVYNNENGDGYIDLGIEEVFNKQAAELGYIRERNHYWINCNVDGNILDLI